MSRPPTFVLAWSAVLLVVLAGPGSSASADPPSSPRDIPAIAGRAHDVIDAVRKHHIDPPARHEMIHFGVAAMFKAAGVPVPDGLEGQVSSLTTREQLATVLAGAWPVPLEDGVSAGERESDAFLGGLLAVVPGHAQLFSAKELKVAEQIRGNRYVGIQVALTTNKEEGRPQIRSVLEGGPAERAGVKEKDLIEEVDGITTEGEALARSIDRLRGEEGTAVTIRVRQPGDKEARTLRMTRGILPRKTITGLRERPDKEWDLIVNGTDPIGYLKIQEIMASTPHELRQMARRLEAEGARALVLDLRSMHTAEFHPTVLLADSLLDGGTIGRVRMTDRVMTYRAEPDSLFRGWPLAVLVDQRTLGAAEWLTAALQDNGRAVVVGSPTSGAAGVETTVPVADGSSSIRLATGLLERGDGRPIGLSPSTFGLRPGQPSRRLLEATKSTNLAMAVRELERMPPDEARAVQRRLDPRMGPLVGVMPDRVATGSKMDEALELALEAYREGPSDETRGRLQGLIARLPRTDNRDAALQKAVPLLRLILKSS